MLVTPYILIALASFLRRQSDELDCCHLVVANGPLNRNQSFRKLNHNMVWDEGNWYAAHLSVLDLLMLVFPMCEISGTELPKCKKCLKFKILKK